MDLDRMRVASDTKLMTEHDWMLGSLLALNPQKVQEQKVQEQIEP